MPPRQQQVHGAQDALGLPMPRMARQPVDMQVGQVQQGQRAHGALGGGGGGSNLKSRSRGAGAQGAGVRARQVNLTPAAARRAPLREGETPSRLPTAGPLNEKAYGRIRSGNLCFTNQDIERGQDALRRMCEL